MIKVRFVKAKRPRSDPNEAIERDLGTVRGNMIIIKMVFTKERDNPGKRDMIESADKISRATDAAISSKKKIIEIKILPFFPNAS